MTRDDVRRLALALPETEESSHLGSPDFRIGGRIFLSFGPKDPRFAVVKLLPGDQEMLTSAEPAIFSPLPGGWGHKGWTRIDLKSADEAALRSALTNAWRSVAPKRLVKAQG